MTRTFYEIAKLLDPCKVKANPSLDQIQLVLDLIPDAKYERYFFHELDNPAWASILEKQDYFLKSPEPIEVEPGSFQIPSWPAVEYLKRIAPNAPSTVLLTSIQITTGNSHTLETLLEALNQIPPEIGILSVDAISKWLNVKFGDYLPIKYGSLIENWADSGFVAEALILFESLLSPIIDKNSSRDPKFQVPIKFKADPYWITEVANKQLPKLIKMNLLGVFGVFDRLMRETIYLVQEAYGKEADLYIGYHWRSEISSRSGHLSTDNVVDVLIDGLRDTLQILCNQSPEIAHTYISNYLNSEYLIHKKIALHVLSIIGQQFPRLVERAFIQKKYLEEQKLHSEYKDLLINQFGTTSDRTQNLVKSWILNGPSDIELRAKNRAQLGNQAVNTDFKQLIRDEWILYHLTLIKDSLSGESLEIFNDLTSKLGEFKITDKQKKIETTWGGVPSPVSADRLKEMNFEELSQYFSKYEPKDLFLNPRESLAEAFRMIVQDDPMKYNEFAKYLNNQQIRFVYIYNFIYGIREGFKKQDYRLSDKVIRLCEYVVNQQDDPYSESSGEYEPGLLTAQLEVARLFEDLLSSQEIVLERNSLDQIRSLLLTLLNHPDPDMEDTESSFDAFTMSLNCVRGVAMHGIIRYSLYINRQNKKLATEIPYKPIIEPDILNALEEKLDKTMDSSHAVHSVYGAYFPQLHYMDGEWTSENFNLIFLESKNQKSYWKAAWDAYIINSSVHKKVFSLLIHQYQRAIRYLDPTEGEGEQFKRSPNERLAQHIMLAYITELTDFGHENELLDLFFVNAPDPIRANGIFWLSKVLAEEKPSAQDPLWVKLWTLWDKRLKFIAEFENADNFKQEVSDYMRWLDNVPVGMDATYPLLNQSIPYFHDGFHVQQMIAYTVKYSQSYPNESVNLLRNAIISAKEPWWKPKEDDEEEILRTALTSENPEAKQIAIEVINFRGEQGNFRWKELLDR